MPDEVLNLLPDADLLARAQRGDERAFEALYFRHRDFVYRVARRFSGDDELALDAAQEVFAYLLRKLPRLKLTGKLCTYLYPIAKNCGVNSRRKHYRFRPGMEVYLDPLGDFPLEDPVAFRLPDEPLAVWTAVAGLPEAQREVLLMRVVDEMSVEEVAAALGVPEGTVKSRLFHALGALRGQEGLRAYWEDEPRTE